MKKLNPSVIFAMFLAACGGQTRTVQSEVTTNNLPATTQTPAPPSIPTPATTAPPVAPIDRSQWPTTDQRFTSFITASQTVQAERPEVAIIFIMADWCPACQKTMAFWQKRPLTPALYVVDGMQMPKSEVRAFQVLELPTQVPTCFVVENSAIVGLGLGVDECTTGLLGPSL